VALVAWAYTTLPIAARWLALARTGGAPVPVRTAPSPTPSAVSPTVMYCRVPLGCGCPVAPVEREQPQLPIEVRLATSVLSGLPRAAPVIRNLADLGAPTTGWGAALALSPPSVQTTTSACDTAALRHNLPADCWAP
jgi:hypothetical protein